MEEEEKRTKVLKKAIHEGIDSGIAENFNPQKHLLKLKANKEKKLKQNTDIKNQ